MSLYTNSAEMPIKKQSPSPCSFSEPAEMRHSCQNTPSFRSNSFNSHEHWSGCDHVILYYTNIRDELLRCVKPAEPPLKLKVSRKDFRAGHYFDDSHSIKDLIENMKPSFSTTPLAGSSPPSPAYRRRTSSAAPGSLMNKDSKMIGCRASTSHNTSCPFRNPRLYGVRNAVLLSELEEKQKIRDAEREAYLDDLRIRMNNIPVEVNPTLSKGILASSEDISAENLTATSTTGAINSSAGFTSGLGANVFHNSNNTNVGCSREAAMNRHRSRMKAPGGIPDGVAQHSRELLKEKNTRSKQVLDSIVKGWVTEGMGEHIPEVQLVNADRSVLSQIEKGSFRAERPPPLPFFKLRRPFTAVLRKASSPPFAQGASLSPHASSPSLEAIERAPNIPVRPSTAPSRPSSGDIQEHPVKLLSRSQDTSNSIVHQYLKDIHEQPIRSYRAFYNATVAPQKIKKSERMKLKRDELGGSLYYREEVERSRHRFDHLRFEKQVEIEDFIRWRGQCRGVVSAALKNTGEKEALNTKQLKLFGYSEKSHLQASTRTQKQSSAYKSPWLKAAVTLAVDEERKRICECIEKFKLDFTAATLSKEAMESLRAKVLAKIRERPVSLSDTRLFSKGEFLAFLSSGTRKEDLESPAGAMITSSGFDVIDAMHSPAEAALAKYILSILPT